MTKDDYKQLYEQVCEQYDVLAKELEATNRQVEILSDALAESRREVAAIKQARALDKKAENARELGLDYEPADGTQVSKVWWDGEKLMAKPIPFVEFYKPVQDSTCNETLRAQGKAYPRTCRKCGKGPCIADRVQPEQPEQEPVAWMFTDVEGTEFFEEREDWEGKWTPLYTTPPAANRQWVGLTNEQKLQAVKEFRDAPVALVFHIEAKLKEKNT
jgi:hypothetical protein